MTESNQNIKVTPGALNEELSFDPRNHDPAQLVIRGASFELSEKSVRRWIGCVVGEGNFDRDEWGARGIFPKIFLGGMRSLPRITVQSVHHSTVDHFQKVVFRTADDLLIETVIIPLHKSACVTVCLSSQVGCAMACSFCATARMPTRRNLETWEIVDQFIQARALAETQGKKVTGAVFMGMGEPFLNYEHVLAAAELLRFPVRNAIDARAITISTVGLVRQIDRFIDEKRPFRLSISIGAATDEKRSKLVPVAARTPIKEVMARAKNYAISRRERAMIAYVCIGGENVFEEDAKALGALTQGIPIRLDLIEVNDLSGTFRRPTEKEMTCFRDALTQYVRQPVVRRYSGGLDIRAACGTLAGERELHDSAQ